MNSFEEFSPEKSCPQEGQNHESIASALVDTSHLTEFSERPATPFHGLVDLEPNHILIKEEPHHRLMCILFAQGFSIQEIARHTKYHPSTVANVRKQPWAQKYISEAMESMGRKLIMNQLSGAAAHAAKILCDAVEPDNPLGLKPEDRVKNAHKHLERLYGTAPQTILHGNVDPETLSTAELQSIVAAGER